MRVESDLLCSVCDNPATCVVTYDGENDAEVNHCADCLDAARTLLGGKPSPGLVVCGDHWHGLGGEPVNGSTGCPWCLAEERMQQIAALEAAPRPCGCEACRLVKRFGGAMDANGFYRSLLELNRLANSLLAEGKEGSGGE